MGRSRQFDASQALKESTIVFWKQGFRDTSVEQIVSATGVSRYGLYQEFGNKKDLYKRCLNQYAKFNIGPALRLLAGSDGDLNDLRCFFNLYIKNISAHGANGCLICNTATELGDTDVEVNEIVREIANGLGRYKTLSGLRGL